MIHAIILNLKIDNNNNSDNKDLDKQLILLMNLNIIQLNCPTGYDTKIMNFYLNLLI